MNREIIQYQTEAEWLSLRKQDITSTEVAALFASSPYMTEFELYHRKAGTLTADTFEVNERMVWGNRLEAAIAFGVAEDFGLIVEPMKVYARVPELRMGSSFDFKVVGIVEGFEGDQSARDMFRQHGHGILEVKNVDGLQFKRGWVEEGETIEAPLHIEFQVQAQLEVADLNWALIAPLVGGNTPKVVIRERDRDVGAAIMERVTTFWKRVITNTPPEPDYLNDADTIGQLYVENDGSAIDLSDDATLIARCIEYKAAAKDAKDADDRKKAARAEILTIIKAAKSVTTQGFKLSAGTNNAVFKAYRKEAGERLTITLSQTKPVDIEAHVAPFRNVRITEAA
jgi:putative phage-type endonuclease